MLENVLLCFFPPIYFFVFHLSEKKKKLHTVETEGSKLSHFPKILM